MELLLLFLILNMAADVAIVRPNLSPRQETRVKMIARSVKATALAFILFCFSCTHPFPRAQAAPLSPILSKILRQTTRNSFYTYTNMLGSYSRGRVSGASELCPTDFSITEVMPPEPNSTFSYRIPHNKMFAEEIPCSSSSGPFTAEYSFLENAIYIPGDLLQALQNYQITRELSAKFEDNNLIMDGSRSYFGFDANQRSCGKYTFPPGTLVMFFASKTVVKLSGLGYLNAGKKYMIILVHNGIHDLATCAYNAPHQYYNNRALPTQFINPSATPSNTPTPSLTPSNTPAPSVSSSMTPTASMSSSPSAQASSTPSSGSSRSPTTSPSLKPYIFVNLFQSPFSADNNDNSSSILPETASTSATTNERTNSSGSTISASPTPSSSHAIREITTAIQNSSPNPSNVTTLASSCFDASSSVQLRNGRKVPMKAVRIRDEVRVGRDKYSPVFMFTHRVPQKLFRFISFYLQNGDVVKMTEGHLTYADGKLTPAREVMVGQKLQNVGGDRIRITRIRTSHGIGLYNPQTAHGDIVVDGYVHSTYTDTISPRTAHSTLTVFRFLSAYTGVTIESFEGGIDILPAWMQSALTRKRND